MADIFSVFNELEDGTMEVDTSYCKDREDYNHVIMMILTYMIDKHPELRFNQLLIDCSTTVVGEDLFHEESRMTLARMMKDELVSKYFKFKKQEGEVIEFNKRG